MKSYKKSKLEYRNGYLVTKKGKVIALPDGLVYAANRLDNDVQRAYHDLHVKAIPQSQEEFRKVSEFQTLRVEADTPNLDAAAAIALDVMDDIDKTNVADKANEYLQAIHQLVEFVMADEIVSSNQSNMVRFDLPVVGNPLELDHKKLMDFVLMVVDPDYTLHSMEKANEDDE